MRVKDLYSGTFDFMRRSPSIFFGLIGLTILVQFAGSMIPLIGGLAPAVWALFATPALAVAVVARERITFGEAFKQGNGNVFSYFIRGLIVVLLLIAPIILAAFAIVALFSTLAPGVAAAILVIPAIAAAITLTIVSLYVTAAAIWGDKAPGFDDVYLHVKDNLKAFAGLLGGYIAAGVLTIAAFAPLVVVILGDGGDLGLLAIILFAIVATVVFEFLSQFVTVLGIRFLALMRAEEPVVEAPQPEAA